MRKEGCVLNSAPIVDETSNEEIKNFNLIGSNFSWIYVNPPICLVASSDGTLTGEAEELKCCYDRTSQLEWFEFSCMIF
jgi:hypothetical protein